MLYTVEFEERHAGQTAAGVEQFWFKRIETFAEGHFDNPLRRAVALFSQLKVADPTTIRNVVLTTWAKMEG